MIVMVDARITCEVKCTQLEKSMAFLFDPNQYGQKTAHVLGDDRLNELGPGEPNAAAHSLLSSLTAVDIFAGETVEDPMMAQCCLSALWLYHDYLDESHAISQSIPTTEGSYWHGIMHRREPDYSNAKYWFRKIDRHAAYGPLLQDAAALIQKQSPAPQLAKLATGAAWDAFAFVDVCEAYNQQGTDNEKLCRLIQRLEWNLLFDHCYKRAIGKNL